MVNLMYLLLSACMMYLLLEKSLKLTYINLTVAHRIVGRSLILHCIILFDQQSKGYKCHKWYIIYIVYSTMCLYIYIKNECVESTN